MKCSRIKKKSVIWKRMMLKSLAAAFIAVFLLLFLMFGMRIVSVRYLQTSARAAEKQEKLVSALKHYVRRKNISVRDVTALRDWEKDRHVELMILGTAGEQEKLLSQIENYAVDENDLDRVTRLRQARPIRFADGELWIIVTPVRPMIYWWLDLICAVLFLIVVYAVSLMVLMRKDIEYMVYLRDELNMMSGGDLTREIRPYLNTEIGQIGEGVNELRKSVADKIQKEYEALTANRELITAMSHDLRTPLTRQIGYLEILHLKKYEDENQRELYTEKARTNAFLMKDTTDKLFRYFLAFGNQEQKDKMVEVDGRTLLNSTLQEQADYLKSQQFPVSFSRIDKPLRMEIDPEEFGRIFDNIFQNIKKYGDNAVPVVISCESDEKRILMMIQNGIREDLGKVESTHIGLKVVDRIITAMKGSMEVFNDGSVFIIQLMFPLVRTEE